MLRKVTIVIAFEVWLKKRRGHRWAHGRASDILALDAWCSGENTHSHLVLLHRLLPTTEPWPSPWAASLSGRFQPLPLAEGHLQHSCDPRHCFRLVPLPLAPPLLSLLPLPVSRNFPAQQGWPHSSPSLKPSFLKIPSHHLLAPLCRPPSLSPTVPTADGQRHFLSSSPLNTSAHLLGTPSSPVPIRQLFPSFRLSVYIVSSEKLSRLPLHPLLLPQCSQGRGHRLMFVHLPTKLHEDRDDVMPTLWHTVGTQQGL